MRVTHVITRLIVGGAQENTIATVLGLRKIPGIDVKLISGPTIGSEGSLELSLQSSTGAPAFDIVPELVRPIHPWKDLLALRKLTKIFQDTKPDIVHTHSGKAGILGRLAAARANVPIIIHTVHGPSFGPFQGAAANFIFRAAERRASRVTTHFVVVADAMKHQYLAAGLGRDDQYTRILSGFDVAPFLAAQNNLQLRAKWGIQPDDIVIGKIARLFKLKGHDDLLAVAPDLAKRYPNLKFLLVGDGEWRARFEDIVRTLELQGRVIFTGLVPPTAIPLLIGLMDIVVHLSRREGLPRVLPQALAAKRPIVAYDCDGAREVCFDNETGFLIRPGDLSTLTDRLNLLVQNPELRNKFGERGQTFVRENFTTDRMVQDIYNLYRKLIATHGRPA